MVKGPVNRLPASWPETSVEGTERIRNVQEELSTRIQPWLRRAESVVGEHPRASLVLAATLGATLGWLIKRK